MKQPQSRVTLKGWVALLFFQLAGLVSVAQVKYAAAEVNTIVSGTSTVHDWDMKSSKGECTATFAFNKDGQITGISDLRFVMPAESLKSEHAAMDKNAYKALKTVANPIISFTLNNGVIAPNGDVKCQGKLTIAGVAMDTDVAANVKVKGDKISAEIGNKKISMKSFSIVPPTYMMGAIKTGNDITVSINLLFKK